MSESKSLEICGREYSAVLCACCDLVKVRCGCVVMSLPTDELSEFTTFLKAQFESCFFKEEKTLMNFRFKGVTFSFTQNEAADLIYIMNKATLELDRRRLEALFNAA